MKWWDRLRRRTESTTTMTAAAAARHNAIVAVLDESYAVVDDMRFTTFAACCAADVNNRILETARRQQLDESGCLNDAAVWMAPAESNETRYRAWERDNTPVRADLQAVAVEAMCAQGVDHTAYAPGDIIGAATKPPPISTIPPYTNTRSNVEYIVYSITELDNRSEHECLRADTKNTKVHSALTRRWVARQSRHSNAAWMPIGIRMSPPPSNVERKALIEARKCKVSAVRQAVAVETLYHRGLRVGHHYEPHHAIRTVMQLRSPLVTNPVLKTPRPPSSAPPPLLICPPSSAPPPPSIRPAPPPPSIRPAPPPPSIYPSIPADYLWTSPVVAPS